MQIYKITNLVNGKIYIGLTTQELKIRWKGHKQSSKTDTRPLYKAMRKYGIDNFSIDVVEHVDDMRSLGERERHYIKLYDTQNPKNGYNLSAGGEHNQYDENPKAKVTLSEVIQIREIYAMGELRCKECWQLFKHKISFSAFQKIWEGVTWKGIMDDIYTKEAIELHRKQLGCKGESNSQSLYKDSEVLEIRKYYVNHSLDETYKQFGSRSATKDSFRCIIANSYKHIPIYRKRKDIWTLNNIEINIDNYNPVSTILESEE